MTLKNIVSNQLTLSFCFFPPLFSAFTFLFTCCSQNMVNYLRFIWFVLHYKRKLKSLLQFTLWSFYFILYIICFQNVQDKFMFIFIACQLFEWITGNKIRIYFLINYRSFLDASIFLGNIQNTFMFIISASNFFEWITRNKIRNYFLFN